MNTISIINYRTAIGNEWITYNALDIEKWTPKEFKVELIYTIVDSDGEVDYEKAIYDICPAIFGPENVEYELVMWSGLPCVQLGDRTPASLMATGTYKPVHDVLLDMLNKM